MSEWHFKPDYRPDWFVGRKEALEIVLEKARRIVARQPVDKRVVIYRGQRGCGKTWLLRELESRLPGEGFHPHVMRPPESVSPSEVKGSIPQLRPMALLVDDAQDIEEEDRKALLEHILSPLAQKSDVLIVLTERGRPVFWPAPEFHEKSEDYRLGPFKDPKDVAQQVQKQVPDVKVPIAAVHSLGYGYPWSNYILACYLPDREAALEGCVEAFLEGLNGSKRPYLEALAVLKAFDEMHMKPMLQAYPECADKTWGRIACSRVKQELRETTLVCWDRDARGDVIDEPLRVVLEALLQERDRDLWIQLHCIAYGLYRDWAKKYQQSRLWWTDQMNHHAKKLKDADHDPADCLQEDIQEEGENGN
jgi:hypothetical protein